MKKLLLALVLVLGVFSSVFAALPAPTTGAIWYSSQNGLNSQPNCTSSNASDYSCFQGALNTFVVAQGLKTCGGGSSVSGTLGVSGAQVSPFQICYAGGASAGYYVAVEYNIPVCGGSNQIVSGSSCACASGFVVVGAACVSSGTSAVLTAQSYVNQNGYVAAGNSPSTSMCVGGVTVQGSTSIVTGGINFIGGPYSSTGSSCVVGSGAGSAAPAATNAGAGTTPGTCSGYWGQVGGANVCVPTSNGALAVAGASSSNNGTSSGAGSTLNGTANSVNTVCSNGSCTTTNISTVTVNGVAGTPTTTTATVPVATYCTANPLDVQCKPVEDPCTKDPTLAGCSHLDTVVAPAFTAVDSGFTSISSVLFASASGCPADIPFAVLGRTYAISYSGVCSTLQTYVAPIVLVLSAGAAMYLFVNGFKV